MNHQLIPPHEKLTDEQKAKLLEEQGISARQLPKILISDPMVEVLKAKPGDVIKVERPSPTAGKAVYYRMVIEG